MMGKYQLDAKGKKSVEKFHEKNSTKSKNSSKQNETQEKIAALRAKLEKNAKGKGKNYNEAKK